MSLADNGQLRKKEGKTKATCATSRAEEEAAALILKCTEVQRRRRREKGKEVLVCLRLSEVEDKAKQPQLLKQNT